MYTPRAGEAIEVTATTGGALGTLPTASNRGYLINTGAVAVYYELGPSTMLAGAATTADSIILPGEAIGPVSWAGKDKISCTTASGSAVVRVEPID